MLSIRRNFSITNGGIVLPPFTQRLIVGGVTPAISATFCFDIPVLFSSALNSSYIFSPFSLFCFYQIF
jgi:hypothetical protein